MIITRSYFKGIIHIPNSEDTAPNSNLLGNGTELDLFIEEFERDILIKCFGYPLYYAFVNELDATKPNGLKDTADAKWNDLLNGKDYTLNGISVKWMGLKFKEGQLDRSLIAYYVFCEFLNKDLVTYSGLGVVKERGKNSTPVTSDPLYVSSFRKFYELTEFSNCNNGLRTLYDFIQDMNELNSETYPNWIPKKFENVNLFGI